MVVRKDTEKAQQWLVGNEPGHTILYIRAKCWPLRWKDGCSGKLDERRVIVTLRKPSCHSFLERTARLDLGVVPLAMFVP